MEKWQEEVERFNKVIKIVTDETTKIVESNIKHVFEDQRKTIGIEFHLYKILLATFIFNNLEREDFDEVIEETSDDLLEILNIMKDRVSPKI